MAAASSISPLIFSVLKPKQPRRVVVTGLGAVTPLGRGVDTFWNGLMQGTSAVSKITSFDVSKLPARIAAYVPKGKGAGLFDADSVPDSRRMAPFMQYAFAAAQDAVEDAGGVNLLPKTDAEKERFGIAIGSGIGSMEDIVDTHELLKNDGYRRLSPFFIPRMLINLASGNLSVYYGLKGPNHACVTACATGAHSVGDAFRLIRHGEADAMLAGGSDSCINAISVAGFCRARALCTAFNEEPEKASRPFDAQREGFVMGEGAGVLVLEEYERAIARGARIYAEIRGCGLSGDAHHITAPREDGEGAARAMRLALKQGGLPASSVQYVNAHATSTPLGDAAELRAIASVFGNGSMDLTQTGLAVSSIKGATGHLLGAAGAVEAIATILSIHKNTLPPTVNLDTPDAGGVQVNLVPKKPQEMPVYAALSNSFGFGGTNTSLLFTKPGGTVQECNEAT